MIALVVVSATVGKLSAGLLLVIIVVGGIGGGLALFEWWRDNRSYRQRDWPKKIRGPIGYSRLHREVKAVQRKYRNAGPDLVVGVHYGGMVFAPYFAEAFEADLIMAKPLVKPDPNGGRPECHAVECPSGQCVKGKSVWLVDNQIWTGKTMELAREAVLSAGARDVHTVVMHRNGDSYQLEGDQPDLLIFRSRSQLRKLIR